MRRAAMWRRTRRGGAAGGASIVHFASAHSYSKHVAHFRPRRRPASGAVVQSLAMPQSASATTGLASAPGAGVRYGVSLPGELPLVNKGACSEEARGAGGGRGGVGWRARQLC